MAFSIRRATFVDESRGIKPSSGFKGAATRRLDVTIWHPTNVVGSASPLIIYSHGTWGHAEYATYVTHALAEHGYVVAAPNYPLTSCSSFTKVTRPNISDAIDQIADIRFVIDRLLADDALAIDAKRIAIMGHSLGAVTSYFATFGAQIRDSRIVATALTGAGDPVQAALTSNMGLAGTAHAAVSIPTLFLTGEHDLFARMTGGQYAAYARIAKPKYQVMIKGGVHSWFHDGNEQPTNGKNPDCLFFENLQPTMKVPGCDERVPLIGAPRQHEITLAALLTFFDGYLNGNAAALQQLRDLDKRFAEVDLTYEDS